MSRRNTPPERHERQRARVEEARRDRQRSPAERRPDALWLYGIHPVLAALANPHRAVRRILATQNALARLAEAGATFSLAPEETSPRFRYQTLASGVSLLSCDVIGPWNAMPLL